MVCDLVDDVDVSGRCGSFGIAGDHEDATDEQRCHEANAHFCFSSQRNGSKAFQPRFLGTADVEKAAVGADWYDNTKQERTTDIAKSFMQGLSPNGETN
jgi:hypothetical protein